MGDQVRPLSEMSTIQIELTSACVLKCSNCTRFCGTHRVPFFMEEDLFRSAIDSLVGYAQQSHAIVGFMGGEPLLHPKFAEFCEYALSKIPREHLGLWSTFPDAPKYRGYREIICETFGNILLNDHSRDDILHAPILMAAEDCFTRECPVCNGHKFVPNPSPNAAIPYDEYAEIKCERCNGSGIITNDADLFAATEHCWIQESWSAAINPKGAWFCEVAASLSDLFNGPQGWDVQPDWWKATTKDFAAQRDWACRKCGAALPIKRIRNSQDERDDISESNLERLKAVGSRKVAKGDYHVRGFEFDRSLMENHGYPAQTYKDEVYRKGIAARYGIALRLNSKGYWEPVLEESIPEEPPRPDSLFKIFQEQYR